MDTPQPEVYWQCGMSVTKKPTNVLETRQTALRPRSTIAADWQRGLLLSGFSEFRPLLSGVSLSDAIFEFRGEQLGLRFGSAGNALVVMLVRATHPLDIARLKQFADESNTILAARVFDTLVA